MKPYVLEALFSVMYPLVILALVVYMVYSSDVVTQILSFITDSSSFPIV